MITLGQKLPNLILRKKTDKIYEVFCDDFFSSKKVILFGLPGAFTPTCSAKHLPGYIELFDDIINKGVDTIACISVNDPHVMKAWAEHNKVLDKIVMLADSDCSFSKAIGLSHDYGVILGKRSLRFSMIVKDCIVEQLFVEEVGNFNVSSAHNIIKFL